MASESPASIERWTAKRRVALVVGILKGETPVSSPVKATLPMENFGLLTLAPF